MNMNAKWNMSRWRWGFSAAMAALTLVAAVQSTRTYHAHEMTTGLVAVIALAVLLLVGLASLGLARLRIARELAALRSASIGGGGIGSELLAARQRRLEVICASGARPEPDILAHATRADEAGRAYIGRYLVATAVLIGLVGTFAALMQTLGKMAPLFVDKDGGDITSLVAPLAGLHVTFGASLVAILATLSLALASGDLTLCEDQALALLEDRTTHELIPRLWPNTNDVAERTVRAVEDLKTIFADTLGRSIEASLKGISENARAQTDRSARTLETVAATIEKEVARLCAAVESTMEQGVARHGRALDDAAERMARLSASAVGESTARSAGLLEESAQRTSRSVEALLRGAIEATERTAHVSAEAVTRTLQPLFVEESARLEGLRGALADVGGQIDATARQLVELTSSLDGLAREHVASIDRSAQAVLASFDRAVLGGGAALDAAAGTLATAARDLQSGAETLAPRMGALATELGALGREVALLLASRGPDGDVGAVVLGELDRLGEGMERLAALVRAANPQGEGALVDPETAGVAPAKTVALTEDDAESVDGPEPSPLVVSSPLGGLSEGLAGLSPETDAAADAAVADTVDGHADTSNNDPETSS